MTEEISDKLNKILISGQIEDNMKFMIENIPEITNMIGFDHKHPHHHLDVWEHTIEAMNNLDSLEDLEIDMAVLLHDIGKPFSCQEGEIRHFHGHPEVSAKMAEDILKRLGYDKVFIENVCYLVKTHDTIIDPNNLDNSYNMIEKRLKIQYADAKAHKKDKVGKRIELLDNIKNELQKTIGEERD